MIFDKGVNCITVSFMICSPHEIGFAWLNQEQWGGQDMLHTLEWGEMRTGFWWGNLR